MPKFFGQSGGGSSEADVRTFWWKKLQIFLNLWYFRTDKGKGGRRGALRQCGRFSDKGGGNQFSRFCADIFYGRPLIYFIYDL